MADSVEKPRILLVGSLVLAASLFTFYLTGSLWLNLFIMLLIGLGVGTYEGVTDAMLLDIHEKRQSLHININHFFVTLGAILITLYLIFLEMNWRISLVQSAAIVLILALVYGLSRLPKGNGPREDYFQRIRIISRDKVVGALFIASALVVGVEAGTIGMLTTYLMDLRGFTQTTSKIGLVLFLTGIAAGRIVIGYFSNDRKPARFILVLFAASTTTYTLLFLLNAGAWIYGGVFLAGFSISAILPLIITLAGTTYPEMAGTVIGSIKVAIPVGGILLPFLLSLATNQISLEISLFIFPMALLIGLILLSAVFKHDPRLVEQHG